MATTIINGSIVGRDNLSGTGANSISVADIIAAKMNAKLAEAEREANGEQSDNQGGVTITGGTITIGGRVVSGDLFTDK